MKIKHLLFLLFLQLLACKTDKIEEAAPPKNIYLGGDLSYVNEVEDCGAVFRDKGNEVDPYELFAERGANIVRLRLWHTPDWTAYSTCSTRWGQGSHWENATFFDAANENQVLPGIDFLVYPRSQ